MIKSSINIDSVKSEITRLKGQDVNVKVNLGRNRTALYVGKVAGVYQDIFTIMPYGQFKGKTTFSYSEIICGNVKIKKAEENAKDVVLRP